MFPKKAPDFTPRLPHVAPKPPAPVAPPAPPPPPPMKIVKPKKAVKAPLPPAPVAVGGSVGFSAGTFQTLPSIVSAAPAPRLLSDPPAPAIPSNNLSPSMETFTSQGESYFALAGAAAEGWSVFPATTTLDMSGNNINMLGGSILSTLTATVSTVVADSIRLDQNVLTTAGTNELLLNGIPIATTANISTLADWSYDPAVSTLVMDNNNIRGAADIEVSSINGIPSSAINAAQWATYAASGNVNMASNNLLSTTSVALNTGGNVAALTAGAGNQLFVNGAPVGGGGGTPATWANYPAISAVSIPNQDFNISNSAGGLTGFSNATINANLTVGALSNAPFRPTINLYPDNLNVGSLVSPTLGVNFYSLGGINLNSAVGVSLAGGGGVSIAGVGGINLTGGGGVTVASGGILVSGGGIAVTAGGMAINGGALQIGAGGAAFTGGGSLSMPAQSIVMGGSNAKITQGDSSTNGGGITMYGADLTLNSTGARQSILHTPRIEMIGGSTGSYIYDNAGLLQITGLSTVNGAPYGGGTVTLPPNVTLSTLTAATFVSTPNLVTEYIFGQTDLHMGYITAGSNNITIGTNAAETVFVSPVAMDTLEVSTINGKTPVASVGGRNADLSGNIPLIANSGLTIENVPGGLEFNNTGVLTINNTAGALNLTSANGQLTITQSGNDIIFTENVGFPSSIANASSFITIDASGGILTDSRNNSTAQDIITYASGGLRQYTDSYYLLQNNLNLSKMDIKQQGQIVLTTQATSLTVGQNADVIPPVGLFLDRTRLTYNGADLLATPSTISSFTTASVSSLSVSSINGRQYSPSSISNVGSYVSVDVSGALRMDTSAAPGDQDISVFAQGALNLQSFTGDLEVKNLGAGTAVIMDLSGNVKINSADTALTLGIAADVAPSTGLFIDSTRLIYNGSSLVLNPSTLSTATISSLTTSSINGLAFPAGLPLVSSFNQASVSSLNVSSINGTQYSPSSISNAAGFVSVDNAGNITAQNTFSPPGAGMTLNTNGTLIIESQTDTVNIFSVNNGSDIRLDNTGNAVVTTTNTGVAANGNIYLYNGVSQVIVGSAGDPTPPLGLFVDNTRLTYNGSSILGGGSATSTFATASVSSLSCSSINGHTPLTTLNGVGASPNGNINFFGSSYIDVTSSIAGVTIANTGVTSINNTSGDLNLTSGNGLLTIALSGTDIVFTETENPFFNTTSISTLNVSSINGRDPNTSTVSSYIENASSFVKIDGTGSILLDTRNNVTPGQFIRAVSDGILSLNGASAEMKTLTSNAVLNLNQNGGISLNNLSTAFSMGQSGGIALTSPSTSFIMDATTAVTMTNPLTAVRLGVSGDALPSTGLYLDNTRLTYNGTSLLKPSTISNALSYMTLNTAGAAYIDTTSTIGAQPINITAGGPLTMKTPSTMELVGAAGAYMLMDTSGNVFLRNTDSQLVVGGPADVIPTVGLYIDSTHLNYNGASLLINPSQLSTASVSSLSVSSINGFQYSPSSIIAASSFVSVAPTSGLININNVSSQVADTGINIRSRGGILGASEKDIFFAAQTTGVDASVFLDGLQGRVKLATQETSLAIGLPPDIPDPVGLYMDMGRLIFNNETVLRNNAATATISSITTSSINGAVFPAPLISTFNTAYISSITTSSINGISYPPPAQTAFDNFSISSLTCSTINGNLQIGESGDITTGNVTANYGLTLAGAATFTVNGNTGDEGNILTIASGYPAWVAPAATPVTVSAFTDTVITADLVSTVSVLASTSITTVSTSYILAQLNTSIESLSNQYRNVRMNLGIDSNLSLSSFTSLPAGVTHYAIGSMSYRVQVPAGTHNVVAYISTDQDTVGQVASVSLSALGNLA